MSYLFLYKGVLKPFQRVINAQVEAFNLFFQQLHGRSREQRYTKLADWDYIDKVAAAGDPMPIFGKQTNMTDT